MKNKKYSIVVCGWMESVPNSIGLHQVARFVVEETSCWRANQIAKNRFLELFNFCNRVFVVLNEVQK